MRRPVGFPIPDDRFPFARVFAGVFVGALVGFGLGRWAAGSSAPQIDSDLATEDSRVDVVAPNVESNEAFAGPRGFDLADAADDSSRGPAHRLDSTSEAEPPAEPLEVSTRVDPSASRRDEPLQPLSAGRRLRVRRGSVAYLRCDGVPVGPGPHPCPRDPDLEAAVWAALEAADGCPDLAPGVADLVLELRPGAPTEVRTRDTFAADAVRTDSASLARCVADLLVSMRSNQTASRLVVSFRLEVQPPADP